MLSKYLMCKWLSYKEKIVCGDPQLFCQDTNNYYNTIITIYI